MFYIVSYYPPTKGGAEIFLQEVQKWLIEEGKETKWVHSVDHVKDATLIITSGVNQTNTAQWADNNNVPCIVLIQHWKEVYHPQKRIIDDSFFKLIGTRAILSCCSIFLRQEIKDICNVLIPRVVYPVGKYITNYKWNGGEYLFSPNISYDKGGIMFNDLIDSGISLVGVSHSDSKYERMIKKKARNVDHILIINRIIDRDFVYALMKYARAVLCVNNIEETFCKTAWEAMCIGTPVICKKNGNFPYLFGEWGNYVSCARDVITMYKCNRLQHRDRSQMCCPLQSKSILMGMIEDAIYPTSRTMFMGPWSDQGLGRQMRRYVRESETSPVVFSWKCAINKDIIFQGSSKDWVHTHVYWSNNHRETVTKNEIESVIREFKIDTLYALEPASSMLKELKGLPCVTTVIPNIETVKKQELQLYQSFDQIICHTKQCYNYFNMYSNAVYHPLAFTNFEGISISSSHVKYLLLGGPKPFGRKQAERIINVFQDFDDCSLTVTWQTKHDATYRGINVIRKNMNSEEIDELYRSHDVVIVLSNQEGLGLSIIEALERGKPVIATDMAPHNEYVKHGINGWLISGKAIPLMNNTDPLFSGTVFDSVQLINTIIMINKLAAEKNNAINKT